MSIAGWIVIGVMVAIGIADWLIVMGADPRRWKGGDVDDGDMEAYKRNNR